MKNAKTINTQEMTPAEREKAFNKIWSNTHRESRGRFQDGTKSVVSWAGFGAGGLVTAQTISQEELNFRLGF